MTTKASDEQFPERDEAVVETTTEPDTDLLALLEAMLFVCPEALSAEEIAVALEDRSAEEIEAGLAALDRSLVAPERGLQLERVAGAFRLVTRPELAAPLQALFRHRNRKRLTPAVLDVLAIVAYAQPITSPEVHEIRGTDPAYALKVLLDRKLVRMIGRKRVVGRPILYGTTKEFLVHFGLDSLEDLPPVEAFGTRVVPAQGRLFPVTDGEEEGEPLIDDESLADTEPLDESERAPAQPALAEQPEQPAAAAGGGGRSEGESVPIVPDPPPAPRDIRPGDH